MISLSIGLRLLCWMELISEMIMCYNIHHPHILYKYRIWDNLYHKKVLEDSSVYLSPPRDFEDKMDCNPAQIYPSGISLFRFLLRYKQDLPFIQRVNFALKWYNVSPINYPDELKNIKNQIDNVFNDHFGVLSLTTDSRNDFLWERYADHHKGFCVGFDWNRITRFIRGGGKVIYVKRLPVIDFANDDDDTKIIKTIIYKEKKWEKENEYRLFKIWDVGQKVIRNIKLPQDAIVQVVLGKRMSAENKREIKKIVSIKYPNTKVIEM